MITDHLNVLALLGIINLIPSEGRSLEFTLDPFTLSLLSSREWKDNLLDIMRVNALKLPWIREILLAISIYPEDNISSICNLLEYTRPGFDKESIKFSHKLARDLELISDSLEITNFAKKYLWQKMKILEEKI